jgi:hypothetical protein
MPAIGVIRPSPGCLNPRRKQSLFASFSSEKEESSFFEKKEAKKLLFLVLSAGALSLADHFRTYDTGF